MKTKIQLRLILLIIGNQLCWNALGESTVSERITGRDYPSVFQAWNPTENIKGESKVVTEARHDLIFHAPDFFGLRWDTEPQGSATGFNKVSLKAGERRRANLMKLNPHMILLCEIRYRDAHRPFLPKGHA